MELSFTSQADRALFAIREKLIREKLIIFLSEAELRLTRWSSLLPEKRIIFFLQRQLSRSTPALAASRLHTDISCEVELSDPLYGISSD